MTNFANWWAHLSMSAATAWSIGVWLVVLVVWEVVIEVRPNGPKRGATPRKSVYTIWGTGNLRVATVARIMTALTDCEARAPVAERAAWREARADFGNVLRDEGTDFLFPLPRREAE